MKPNKPAPGSVAAIRKGCICPIDENKHGTGADGQGKRYYINQTCPVHGEDLNE